MAMATAPRRRSGGWQLLGLCILLLLSLHFVAADASNEASSSRNSSAIAAANLAELLRLSSSSPSSLIPLTASRLSRWAEGDDGANVDRHYALVVYLTASAQCVACGSIQRELASVAALYERARRPLGSRLPGTADTRTLPAHHIFFTVLDADRRVEADGSEQMSNLKLFNARKITRVPELFLLPFTVPEGMVPHSGRDIGQSEEVHSSNSNGTTEGNDDDAPMTGAERRRLRSQAMQERLRLLHQGSRNASSAADQSAASSRVAGVARPSAASSSQYPYSWLDPNQVVTFPISAGVQGAQQLLVWLRQNLEAHVTPAERAAAARGEFDALEAMPLHRSMVVRRGGVRLSPEAAELAAGVKRKAVQQQPNLQDVADRSFLMMVYNRLESFARGFQPFLSSFLLLCVMVMLWYKRLARFALVPASFFLWNAVGSMNNIAKQMPFVGMDKSGPMFFYPGHGSFIGEACLMASIYASMAGCILALNRATLWKVAAPAPAPAPPTSAAPPTTAAAAATGEEDAAFEKIMRDSDDEDEPTTPGAAASSSSSSSPAEAAASAPAAAATATAPVPLKPGQVRASASLLAAAAAAREKKQAALQARQRQLDADWEGDEPFGLSTRQWVLLLVGTLLVLFSLLRSIYTRKNARYNFGYVWP